MVRRVEFCCKKSRFKESIVVGMRNMLYTKSTLIGSLAFFGTVNAKDYSVTVGVGLLGLANISMDNMACQKNLHWWLCRHGLIPKTG